MADDTIAHEDILRMAAECGFPVNWQHPDVRAIKLKRFVDFAALIAAAERSACAQVCEALGRGHGVAFAEYDCAAAIRARGEK